MTYYIQNREASAVLHIRISIRVPGAPGEAPLYTFVMDPMSHAPDALRPAVIICPGGGYTFTSDREAEPIAARFLADGFNAYLLRYHCAPSRYPVPQLELASAVDQVRRRAVSDHTDPDRIFVLGFSAGAHLAACIGTLWRKAGWAETLGLAPEQIRPAGMVLCYPVISCEHGVAHEGSFDSLLAERRSELEQSLSLEKQVTSDTVPAFIWHTFTDESVPVENAIRFADAMKKAERPVCLYLYPEGVHGLSLGSELTAARPAQVVPGVQDWPAKASRWMQTLI